jgi:hypothetical protein
MLAECGDEVLMVGLSTETVQGIEHGKIGFSGAILFDALSSRYPIRGIRFEGIKKRLKKRCFPNPCFSRDEDGASFAVED